MFPTVCGNGGENGESLEGETKRTVTVLLNVN